MPRSTCSWNAASAPSVWTTLTAAAGVVRRTLYEQLASKEEMFREVLPRVSAQLETAVPPRHQTQADVEDARRLFAGSEADLAPIRTRPVV
jgi:AcrR family transcriptional regulator